MIKPILINGNDKPDVKSIGLIENGSLGRLNKLGVLLYNNYNDSYIIKDIILINTEAEIKCGDYVLTNTNQIVKMDQPFKCELAVQKQQGSFKIISSTNKTHNLPLLSPQSIQLLINYYNEYKVMPESVEVEDYAMGDLYVGIVISETEEKIYTESEVEDLIIKFKKDNCYCVQMSTTQLFEWFNKNLK